MPLLRGEPILDLGCGPHPRFQNLRAAGQYIGLDFNFNVAKLIGQSVRDLTPVCADATLMPFRDHVFGVVLCKAVLTSVVYQDSCERVLSEACRVLRPGGVLAVADFLENYDDEYFTRRYVEGRANGLPRGAFDVRSREGELVYTARHFERRWIQDHIGEYSDLTLVAYTEVPSITRTGRAITAFMLAAQRAH
ncbi:methyltransferase domain-containing protein [Streptomyces umbrinus]|uniref:methyltransferase domain-containing protein n=1 Tax=Streptomyces umbrinus TaxID=67370 RepID=UPI0033C8DE07